MGRKFEERFAESVGHGPFPSGGSESAWAQTGAAKGDDRNPGGGPRREAVGELNGQGFS